MGFDEIKYIGIRSGEKIHEVMCPKESSHLTIEFSDHFVIYPSNPENKKGMFEKNSVGEKGKKVDKDFEYSSDKNKNFLSIKNIIKLNKLK